MNLVLKEFLLGFSQAATISLFAVIITNVSLVLFQNQKISLYVYDLLGALVYLLVIIAPLIIGIYDFIKRKWWSLAGLVFGIIAAAIILVLVVINTVPLS